MLSTQEDPKYQEGEPGRPEHQSSGVIVSPDTGRANRIPPGQSRTRKWPILHAHDVAAVPLDRWELRIDGLVERPLVFDWASYRSLPRVKVFADFHCVTRWSRLANLWEGVSAKELMIRAGVKPEANFLVATGYDLGWTTNLPLSEFAQDDVLLADTHDGDPIDADHGGPVRLMVPRLYAWKSAKWLRRLTFVAQDAPGYWERLGYHNHGDPWTESRFRVDD